MKTRTILGISGSIREPSTQQTILKTIGEMLPVGIHLSCEANIAGLPWFNPDLDGEGSEAPPPVKQFRERIREADAVVISTPEYVFSLPGVLKNALEWTVSQEVLSRKPVAFVVASASGEKAFESLDVILKTLTQQPVPRDCRLLVRGGRGKFTGGVLTDPQLRTDLENLTRALVRETDRPPFGINQPS